MELIKWQDINVLREIREKTNKMKIRSDITLFNPWYKEASLSNHWWWIDKNKWKIYSEIEIHQENWKHYAKNTYWINVFLTKWLPIWTQNFYFKEIDWKYLLVAEQEWVNYYFLENWKQYFPKTLSEKIEEWLDDFTMASRVSFNQLKNTAYTTEIKKIWDIIDNLIENTKKISSNILNSLLDNISFNPDRTIKIPKKPETPKNKIKK